MSAAVDVGRNAIAVNVQLNWPKLFQAFSVNFTLIFFTSAFTMTLMA